MLIIRWPYVNAEEADSRSLAIPYTSVLRAIRVKTFVLLIDVSFQHVSKTALVFSSSGILLTATTISAHAACSTLRVLYCERLHVRQKNPNALNNELLRLT